MRQMVHTGQWALLLGCLAMVSTAWSSPAAPNLTNIEAVVMKLGAVDKKGHPQITLDLQQVNGDRGFKAGTQLVVVKMAGENTTLKINDTISAMMSEEGDEWHNHVRLFNITVRTRHVPLAMRGLTLKSQVIKDTRRVARSSDGWQGKTQGLFPDLPKQIAAPKVDWSDEMVLLAAMGEQTSTGYSIQIVRVEERLHEIVVLVHTRKPGPKQITGPAMTYPSHLVAIPQSSLPVRFVPEGDEDKPFAVKHTLIAQGTASQWESPIQKIISDEKTWLREWKNTLQKKPAPTIDFSKQQVLLTTLGRVVGAKPTVVIEQALRTPNSLEIRFKDNASASKQKKMMKMASTPYCIAVIDRTDFPIQFVQIITPRTWNYGTAVNSREKASRVIRSLDDWKKTLTGLSASKAGYLQPNFRTEMVLALFVPPTPRNRAVRIVSIDRIDQTLRVKYTATPVSFRSKEPHTGFGFVVIKKSDAKVTFVETNVPAPKDEPVETPRVREKPLPYAVGRIIVLFKDGVTPAQQLEIIKELDCTPSKRFKSINGYLLLIPPKKFPADRAGIERVMNHYLKKMQSHPNIKSAEFDHIMGLH